MPEAIDEAGRARRETHAPTAMVMTSHTKTRGVSRLTWGIRNVSRYSKVKNAVRESS